jgi:hypothetical protein
MSVLRNWFRSLSSLRRRAFSRPHGHKGRRPRQLALESLRLEALENREMLSGFWTPLVNNAPGTVATMMLLPDGTVMAQQGGTANGAAATLNWYQLTPQAFTGDYVNGTWSNRASMSLQRLYYASNVLPNGNVFLAGGEYSGPQGTQNFTNTGEIYNPVSNTWSNIANFPNNQFGDDPSAMLPDGRVLTGYINDQRTYIYNPATNAWSFAANKVQNDQSDEESWVKLPDGSILSYDVFASTNTGTFHAERYVPSTNQWVDASNVNPLNPPSLLSGNNVAAELGAGLLLPDGRALFIGGNNNTAYYSPSADQWSAGPALPTRGATPLVAADAPAAMMPNGNVLMALSPLGTVNAQGNYSFPAPTFVYEFNPNTNVFTDVTPAGFPLNVNAYRTRMLMLPSGQVLLSNDATNQLDVFTPNEAPSDAWRPQITDIERNAAGTVTLTGTQLNGLSEGAAYGDDAEMSSNYPLVRLKNAPFLGTLYLRTSNWSSTGVATGSLPETVQFSMGTGFDVLMNVVANGIASPTVLAIEMSGSNNNILLERDPGNPANLLIQNNGAFWDSVPFSAFSRVIVTGTDNTSNGLIVDYQGGFFDTPVTFHGGGTLGVTDASDSRSSNWTVTDSTIVGAPSGGPGGSVTYLGSQTVTLDSSRGLGTVVNVRGTSALTNLVGWGGTTVNVGDNGLLIHINGTIKISNPSSLTEVNVDASADPVFESYTLDTVSLSGVPFGRVSFGAPAVIEYKYTDTSALTLHTGIGPIGVHVLATGVPTNVIGSILQATVGSSTAGLDAINGAVSVSGSINSLAIDNVHASAGHSVIIDRNFVQRLDKPRINYTGVAQLTFTSVSNGLAGADGITVSDTNPSADTTINNVNGFGTNAASIQRTTGSLAINAGGSAAITVGDNLSNIQGSIAIALASPFVSLTLQDTAATTPRQLDTVTTAVGSSFQASGAAAITVSGQLAGFVWRGGSGGNTLHVHGTPATQSSTFVLGAGNDSLSLSSAAAGNKISNLGFMAIDSGGGGDSLILDDSDETNAQTYRVALAPQLGVFFSTQGTSLSRIFNPNPVPAIILTGSGSGNNTLIGPNATSGWNITGSNAGQLTFGASTVTFTAVQNLTGGSVNNAFVFADGAGIDGNISDVGGGANTLDYSAYSTPVTVDLSAGTATGVGGTVANIHTLRGGAGDDSLTGNAAGGTSFFASPGNDTITGLGTGNSLFSADANGTADSIWNVTAQNSGTLTFPGATTTFSGVQNLGAGGTGSATFIFADGAGVDGNIKGSGGASTLNESAYTTPVTVNVPMGTATGVGGGAPGSVRNIQSFVGGAGGGNNLVGGGTWNITGSNAGTVSTRTFSGFQNLSGSNVGTDTFIFSDGAGVDGIITGGSNFVSSNTLDYSAYTTPVTINRSASSATGVGGGFQNIQNFVGGGGGGNTLIGPSANTTWNLTGSNRGTFGTFPGAPSFTAFQNLTGGAGNNTFVIGAGAGVSGTVTGGGGTNSLDYSAFTGNVIVDLQLTPGFATAIGGLAGTFTNVHGANSAGPGLYNLLIGNGGNVLTGGTGRRNILVAGGTASTLLSGTQEDLVIGGTTSYDTESGLVSWQAIAAYWAGSDPFLTRVTNLETGTGVPLLDSTTVTGNGGGNTMIGAGGLALIYTDGGDTITGYDPGSQTYTITP